MHFSPQPSSASCPYIVLLICARWLPLLQVPYPCRNSIPIKKEGRREEKAQKNPSLHVTLSSGRKIFSRSPQQTLHYFSQLSCGLHVSSSPITGKGERGFHYDSSLRRGEWQPQVAFGWTTNSVSHNKVIQNWVDRKQGI